MFELKTSNQQPKTNVPMNPYVTDEEIDYISEQL